MAARQDAAAVAPARAHIRPDVAAAPELAAAPRPSRLASGAAVDMSSSSPAGHGRHDVLAALSEAVSDAFGSGVGGRFPGSGSSTPVEHEERHAFHAFAHELFDALRPSAMEGQPGRGFAWGHTSADAWAQRLDALVARLAGAAPERVFVSNTGSAAAVHARRGQRRGADCG